MTVFEVLRRKHRELDAAFDAIERTDSFADADAKFRDLSTRIVAHLRAERCVVYPRLAATDGIRIDAHELGQVTRVQDRIEKAIDHLRLGALTEATWRAATRTLREHLGDLANLEEWVVFPLASLAMSTSELRAIADGVLAFEPVALRMSSVTITYDAPSLEPPAAPATPPIVATVPPLVTPDPGDAHDPGDADPGDTLRVPREEPLRPSYDDFDPFVFAA
jgi:hypothetical protein